MTIAPTLPIHVYVSGPAGPKGKVLDAGANLARLAQILADHQPRKTIVLTAGPDGSLVPTEVEVKPRPLPPIPRAISARLKSTRQYRVDGAGSVWVLEHKNNSRPTWLQLFPKFVDGKLKCLVDSKGAEVGVEVVEAA